MFAFFFFFLLYFDNSYSHYLRLPFSNWLMWAGLANRQFNKWVKTVFIYMMFVYLITSLNKCFKDFVKITLYKTILMSIRSFNSWWSWTKPKYLRLTPCKWKAFEIPWQLVRYSDPLDFKLLIRLGTALVFIKLAMSYKDFCCF